MPEVLKIRIDQKDHCVIKIFRNRFHKLRRVVYEKNNQGQTQLVVQTLSRNVEVIESRYIQGNNTANAVQIIVNPVEKLFCEIGYEDRNVENFQFDTFADPAEHPGDAHIC